MPFETLSNLSPAEAPVGVDLTDGLLNPLTSVLVEAAHNLDAAGGSLRVVQTVQGTAEGALIATLEYSSASGATTSL